MAEQVTVGDELLALVYATPTVELGLKTIISLFGRQTAIDLKKYMDSFGSFEKWQEHLRATQELQNSSSVPITPNQEETPL